METNPSNICIFPTDIAYLAINIFPRGNKNGCPFTDVRWVGSLPMDWSLKKAGSFSNFFSRSNFDASSIEWLRPQEICRRLNLRQEPKLVVGKVDRFDINQVPSLVLMMFVGLPYPSTMCSASVGFRP